MIKYTENRNPFTKGSEQREAFKLGYETAVEDEKEDKEAKNDAVIIKIDAILKEIEEFQKKL